MDHRFRGISQGLVVLDKISERRSKDEFKVLIDEYALESAKLFVPLTLIAELAGWARSYYSLEQHVSAIEAYGGPKVPEPTDVAWNQTKQHILEQFRRFPKVTAKSYKRFDDVKWVSSSAAGYGYTGRKGSPGNYEQAKRTAITIAEKLDHDRSYARIALNDSTPDVAFTRTQLSQVKVKSKVRNVWGEAFHYVLLEGLFADPIIDAFKRINSFYYIGHDPLLSVPLTIEEMLSAHDYVYMLDWSGFDASVQEWELRFAFECLEAMMIFPSNVEFQIWRFLIELFIYRKIAGPQGVLYVKTHGIPSGSCFTNIIGSITNYVRIQYIFKRLTNRFASVLTHGDDSLVAVPTTQYIPMERFAEVCAPLHWTINLTKSSVSRRSEQVTFLSRTVREGQNARDELTCLRMLVFPEYPVPSGDISALRAKSISLDAGINSNYLYQISNHLIDSFGLAQSLPSHLSKWDPNEFEARRSSASESL